MPSQLIAPNRTMRHRDEAGGCQPFMIETGRWPGRAPSPHRMPEPYPTTDFARGAFGRNSDELVAETFDRGPQCRQEYLEHGFARHAFDRHSEIHRRDDGAVVTAHRHRDGAETDFSFLVDQRVAALSDAENQLFQSRFV